MKKPTSSQLSRRDFVKGVTVITGGVISASLGLPAIGYIISPALNVKESEAWIPVGPLSNYEIAIPKLFNFNRSQING